MESNYFFFPSAKVLVKSPCIHAHANDQTRMQGFVIVERGGPRWRGIKIGESGLSLACELCPPRRRRWQPADAADAGQQISNVSPPITLCWDGNPAPPRTREAERQRGDTGDWQRARNSVDNEQETGDVERSSRSLSRVPPSLLPCPPPFPFSIPIQGGKGGDGWWLTGWDEA